MNRSLKFTDQILIVKAPEVLNSAENIEIRGVYLVAVLLKMRSFPQTPVLI